MTMPLENLRDLKLDMQNNGWVIECFMFNYKSKKYHVIVKLFLENEAKQNPRASVKLEFREMDNINNILEVEANRLRLFADPNQLRNYFRIEPNINLGDFKKQFEERLGRSIPVKVNKNHTEREKNLLVGILSHSDSEDPNKIYCTGVRRNPKNAKRSPFNVQKTQFLRPRLYAMYKDDQSISFCYSTEKTKERSDEDIIARFADNQSKM